MSLSSRKSLFNLARVMFLITLLCPLYLGAALAEDEVSFGDWLRSPQIKRISYVLILIKKFQDKGVQFKKSPNDYYQALESTINKYPEFQNQRLTIAFMSNVYRSEPENRKVMENLLVGTDTLRSNIFPNAIMRGAEDGIVAIINNDDPKMLALANAGFPIHPSLHLASYQDKYYYVTKDGQYHELLASIFGKGSGSQITTEKTEEIIDPNDNTVAVIRFQDEDHEYLRRFQNGEVAGLLAVLDSGNLKIEIKPTAYYLDFLRKIQESGSYALDYEIKPISKENPPADRSNNEKHTDELYLKNGQVMPCSVVEKDKNGIWVEVEGGKVYFSNNEIKKIVKADESNNTQKDNEK